MPNTNPTMNATTYKSGLDCLRMIEATEEPSIIDAMSEIAPDLARLAVAPHTVDELEAHETRDEDHHEGERQRIQRIDDAHHHTIDDAAEKPSESAVQDTDDQAGQRCSQRDEK